LLVDDNPQNLVALQAILEPLGQNLILATSGQDALRQLLDVEVALILLDVQMPEMDGFETATFIKQREVTRDIPIIFLTAEHDDTAKVFEGYSVGAVDFLLKPFEPLVLRAKVKALIDLWIKSERIRRREVQLRLMEEQTRERELEALQRSSDLRYRNLAEAMPQIVWMADADGRIEYYNKQWYAYTGLTQAESERYGWQVAVHPNDRKAVTKLWQDAVDDGRSFETEYRFRAADETYRWQLGRAVPMRDDDGVVSGWIGTSTDIHDRKLLEVGRMFLVDAGGALSDSLDFQVGLERVVELAVESVGDWCSIDLVDTDGRLERAAVAHSSAVNQQLARALATHDVAESSMTDALQHVIAGGEPVLVPDVDAHVASGTSAYSDYLEIASGLGLNTWLSVPLTARGQRLGVISLFRSAPDAPFGEADRELALELARRVAAAIDTSRLFVEVEHRARASTALATVADGVVLLDEEGVVRLWNPGAAAITGLQADDVVGGVAEEVIPGWSGVQDVPVQPIGASSSAHTVPFEIAGRELWLAMSGVAFEGGTVFAFRDVTETYMVEKMKSDFVATVSHELRTPLASIAGAAATITRDDIELDEATHGRLLEIIVAQAERLAEMVQNLLLASRLDSDMVTPIAATCDVGELIESVVESATAYAPAEVHFEFDLADDLPEVRCDTGHLRQVLANLVENAIKYTPGGGTIGVSSRQANQFVEISVRDCGIGIPRGERRRIFEKFYRLDADMTRGIGGSGLGLYICGELIRLMGGSIAVDDTPGGGTTFTVQVPVVSSGVSRPVPRAKTA
jgi:PAS domain S-box-containing protein